MKNILKPKSKEDIIKEFCDSAKISTYDFKKFLRAMAINRIKIQFLWARSIFQWVFGISMIANAWIALYNKYFWFPIESTKSMLSFINIFWVITWFAIAVIIIIHGMMILVNYYDE
jgi:hypothetical protein